MAEQRSCPQNLSPLGGYGNGSTSRMSEGYLNDLYATGFQEAAQTVLADLARLLWMTPAF